MIAMLSSCYVFSPHRKGTSSTVPTDVTTKAIPNIYEASPAHVTITPQDPTPKGTTVYVNTCEYL